MLAQRGSVAWKIVAVRPGCPEEVPIPEEFQVFAWYSEDPDNPDPASPDAIMNKTDTVSFKETTARFKILSVTSQDARATGSTSPGCPPV